MKIILSHPTANANVRAVAKALANTGLLETFYTSIASFQGSFQHSLGNFKMFNELKRRSFDSLLKPYTKLFPWLEIGRILSNKINARNLTASETGPFSIDKCYSALDNFVAKRITRLNDAEVKGVYAYEDGALYSFRKAKSLGFECFYDLPIGYWRSARILLEAEREKWPEWATTLTGFSDSEEKLARKDEELRLADKIFVASRFTAKTLEHYPGKLAPIEVIPYGFPATIGNRDYATISKSRRLKLLFVGGLSQRKGIANLFSAVEKLTNYVDLTVIGHKPKNNCQVLNEALSKHSWINSLPHNEILKTMREHDVLLFPSLFEGFGLVITEAMSQGTPVITTDRTAGPELIVDGQNGWITEAGSTEALQQRIEDILYRPQLIEQAGREAMKTAALRPWELYGFELSNALKNTIR